jgi:CRISPR-associated protein Cas1
MHQILNTLYVLTQRAYLHLDHDTVKVKVEGETRLQVPMPWAGKSAPSRTPAPAQRATFP